MQGGCGIILPVAAAGGKNWDAAGPGRKAGSGTGIAERTKYGNLDKAALKEGDGFLTGFKAYKQTQGGGRLSRGALVRKSLENQLEFSQQGRLFHEISSFVEEVPPLGTHCRGEEITKTISLKDSPRDFFFFPAAF